MFNNRGEKFKKPYLTRSMQQINAGDVNEATTNKVIDCDGFTSNFF